MKISKHDAKLLLMLAGLLVFLLSYLLVYNPFVEKQDVLQNKINELRPQLQTLEEYEAKLPEYQAAIEEYQATMREQIDKYPSDVRAEDMTLYAKELETRVGIDATALVFSEPALLSEFQGIVPRDGGEADEIIRGYQSNMSMSAAMTYEQLKNLFDYIYDTYEYTSVGSVSVSYDAETAALTGTVEVSKFYLNYPGAPPVTNEMPIVPKGNQNLFGSVG